MTLDDLRSAVRTLVRNRADVLTDPDITAAVNVAYKQLCRGKFPQGRTVRSLTFHELEDTWDLTLVSGQQSYSYPADVAAVQSVHYPRTSGGWFPLYSRSWKRFLELDSGQTGQPYWFTRRGRKLYFAPTPGDAQDGTVVKVSTQRIPDDLTDDSDSPVIPAAYHLVIAYLAAHDLAARFLDEHADSHLSRALALLQRLQDDDELEVIRASNRPIPFSWR